MSKAFTKEDIDPPERSGRARSATGLPPGAANYITPRGAARLQDELMTLRRAGSNDRGRIAELEGILKSITIVDPSDETGAEVCFGARVTVRDKNGELTVYRIVGVEELDWYNDAVSWISPLGRDLLATEQGHNVVLPGIGSAKVIKVEYPID